MNFSNSNHFIVIVSCTMNFARTTTGCNGVNFKELEPTTSLSTEMKELDSESNNRGINYK